MYNLIIILLRLFSFSLGAVSKNECLLQSKTENNNAALHSIERSTTSDNPEENADLICNTGPTCCSESRYRSVDGSCNNLLHPGWGMPQKPYDRLLPYNYGNGISSFPKSVTGNDLPNVRELRYKIFPNEVIIDKRYNLITMQWGQIIAHDMTLTSGVPQTSKQPLTCCNPNGAFAEEAKTNPRCAPIHISCNDPIYASQGKICMDFVRTRSTKTNNCTAPDNPAEPLTSVTSYMDLSPVYGSNKSQADAVRAGCGGRLLSLMRNGQEWPPQDPQADVACDMLLYPNSSCYLADLKTILKNKILYPGAELFVNDYDQMVNPSVYNEYSSAAYRIFHSSIFGYLQKYKENRKLVGEARLSDSFNNPTVLEESNNFDDLARGLSVQLQSYSDQYLDEEITEYFFKGTNKYGDDLRSIDIQRSRDHGLSNYVNTRAVCGLSVPKTFNDLLEYMSAENVSKLEEIYESLEDVELIVAGSLEYQIPEAQMGPTFRCIIIKQFLKTRIADRFFYENGADPNIAFTLGQLQSIRRGASVSRLLCDNVVTINSMQPKAFLKISRKNKIVPCNELPYVDFTLWKEETS